MPGGLKDIKTKEGHTLEECLGSEAVALFLPIDDFKDVQFSWRHQKAMAENICRSELAGRLPEAWEKVYTSFLQPKDGKPLTQTPEVFRRNAALTSVPFQNPHVEAKLFRGTTQNNIAATVMTIGVPTFRRSIAVLLSLSVTVLGAFWFQTLSR